MNKNSYISFTDGRADYHFSSETSLELILKTIKERNWPVLAIHTPDFVLSILSPEEYEHAMANFTFTNLGV